MKLARIGAVGSERLAAVDGGGTYRDISTALADLTPELLADPAPFIQQNRRKTGWFCDALSAAKGADR